MPTLLVALSILFFFLLLPASFLFLIIGMIKPSLFTAVLKQAATRKNIALIFSVFFAMGITLIITDIAMLSGKTIPIEAPAQQAALPIASPSARCLPVPPHVLTSISQGLTIEGGGTLRNAKAVKSDSYQNVYFISADLQGAGLEGSDDLATFARNGLDDMGLVIAVDAVANEFSDWADGRIMTSPITMSDDGARQSQDCASRA
jgi:hypothetical protein